MPISYTPLANSTFLDYTSYGTTSETDVVVAYDIGSYVAAAPTDTVNVALTLSRANDPTTLLASDWATRQTTLAELNASGTLWSTYGASQNAFNDAVTALSGLGLTVLGDDPSQPDGYISSAESRTIWVQLSATDFKTLFDATLYRSTDGSNLYFWKTGLSLPTNLNGVEGLWFDFEMYGPDPAASDLSGGASAAITQGPQSIGNDAGTGHTELFASQMAELLYNFPLSNIDTPTATIGLLEPGSGDVLDPGITGTATFQSLLDRFRREAGIETPAVWYAIEHGGTSYSSSNPTERSLDVGVVTAAAPNSVMGLYAGSGFYTGATSGPGSIKGAASSTYSAYQAAFWDLEHNPAVVSASYGLKQQAMPAQNGMPGSPFAIAAQELFIDAALRNITLVQANNDYGSSWGFANGLANQSISLSSPYALMVGGTSVTTFASAPFDQTVSGAAQSVYGLAMAGDLATLWRLVEGGLTVLPSAATSSDAQLTFLEAVWNTTTITGSQWNGGGAVAGDGGVDTTQSTPWYQTAFGLTPTSVNPDGGTGRGAPDVAANAGGNLFYKWPGAAMNIVGAGDGTSAAAPLWSALIAQIDTIFHDQGLPNLGYATDLFYIAAAVAPASFNDITFGNNTSSYYFGGPLTDSAGNAITLTGYGFYAGPGYDLTTGLGTPNGTLLARALSGIAHSQMYFADQPDIIDADGQGGWTSGADQSLMLQTASSAGVQIGVTDGQGALDFFSSASAAYSWTSRLAQQSLQDDFDPNLVRLYDKFSQGTVSQTTLSASESIAVSINGAQASALRGTLTSSSGFADFSTGDGALRVARPVAIAETAGGQNDQIAIVRLRQNGEDSLTLSFYRVDDLTGAIDGLHPGDAGYAAAAQARGYQMTTGGTAINGPGYGNYAQTGLSGVDAGDLIAMTLTNNTSGNTYWAFAQANEKVDGQHVGHLWNYGANTWGWEDTKGGGDRDFNDLIVGLDFTSASGHGWLI
ncbi:MAG: hypothetical protein HYX38_31100 [Rhodospirillales bacterium]|nr:hypothetical protein [Rhodospirillales bacterium]